MSFNKGGCYEIHYLDFCVKQYNLSLLECLKFISIGSNVIKSSNNENE